MSYASEVLADAPWGFWQEAETSGTTLADSSGGNRPLTVAGGPALGQGGPFSGASAIQFGGAGQYAGTAASFTNLTTGTVECWVYVTAYPTSGSPQQNTPLLGVVQNTTGPTYYDRFLSLQPNGTLMWQTTGNNYVTSPAALSLNTWHHVVASVGAAGAKLRVDKTTVGSNAALTSAPGSAARQFSVRYGNTGMTPGFGGGYGGTSAVAIAMPAYYTTQLSDTRTDAHYDAAVSTPAAVGDGTWGLAF